MSYAKYFECPYCIPVRYDNGRVPKNIGQYRIKELNNGVLMLKCIKCTKVFRVKTVGAKLLWNDLAPYEKKVFKKENWASYARGGKNEKKC